MDGTGALRGWAPCGLRGEAGETLVDWCWLGAERLAEPFFDQSRRRIRATSRVPDRTTRLDELRRVAETDGRDPSGFVFHLSRCGSTLVTQMLAACGRFTALSEPPLLDDVLSPRGGDPARASTLRSALRALGRPRRPDEEVVVVKPASRATRHIALFEEAFPEARWVFLHRDPVEVLVALVGRRADALPPALAGSGLLAGAAAQQPAMRPAEFWARVLAERCASALAALASGRGCLVRHDELPGAVPGKILRWFGVSASPEEVAAMDERARRDAKDPSALHAPDGATRRDAATDEIREAVARFAAPAFAALEAAGVKGMVRPGGLEPPTF